jgi:hypothetical protein
VAKMVSVYSFSNSGYATARDLQEGLARALFI